MINQLDDNELEIAAFETATMEIFENLSFNIKTLKEEFNVSEEFINQYIMAKLLDISIKMSVDLGLTKKLYNRIYRDVWDNNSPVLKDKIINKDSIALH